MNYLLDTNVLIYLRLKMPDAIVAASAQVFNATLLTNDQQLLTVPGVPSQSIELKQV